MAVLNVLLEITAYSFILYGGIRLFGWLLRDRISARLKYALWFLLVLRLLLPATLASPVHLLVIPQNEAVSSQVENASGDAARPGQPASAGAADAPALVSDDTAVLPETADAAQTSSTLPMRIGWPEVLLGVWLAGIAAMLLYFFQLSLRMRQRIKKECTAAPESMNRLLDSLCKSMGLRSRPIILITKWGGSPCLTASLRPKLLLPEQLTAVLDRRQIAFAMKHELTHYRRRDYLVGLLLNLMRCVYWFNPIVWLSASQMLAAMETACDSDIVGGMQDEDRKCYAQTLLTLFNRGGRQDLVLGMAYGNARASAERRIRGVFSKRKSGKGARLAAAALSLVLVLACFTTACQPTPTKPIVVNKGGDVLDKIIAQTPAPTVQYEAPKKWQELINQGNLDVAIDAEINLPDVESFPVIGVEPLQFQGSDVEKAAKVFFGNAVPKNYTADTKEYITKIMLEYKKKLADIENGTYKPEEGEKKSIESYVAKLEKEYKTAPDKEIDDGPADMVLKQDTAGGVSVTLVADLGGEEKAFLSAMNRPRESLSQMSFENYSMNGTADIKVRPLPNEKPAGVNTTLEQAKRAAQDVMERLGITSMALTGTGEVSFLSQKTEDENATSGRQAYELVYSKVYSGIPVTHFESGMPVNQGDSDSKQPAYAPVLSPEQVTVWIDDGGIIRFQWANPTRAGQTLSSNAPVKSFNEIREIFRKQIMYSQGYVPKDITQKTDISKIVFGYFLQPIKNENNKYRAIPVWDFVGEQYSNGKLFLGGGSYEYSFLTVNAIDGSVINRSLGY